VSSVDVLCTSGRHVAGGVVDCRSSHRSLPAAETSHSLWNGANVDHHCRHRSRVGLVQSAALFRIQTHRRSLSLQIYCDLAHSRPSIRHLLPHQSLLFLAETSEFQSVPWCFRCRAKAKIRPPRHSTAPVSFFRSSKPCRNLIKKLLIFSPLLDGEVRNLQIRFSYSYALLSVLDHTISLFCPLFPCFRQFPRDYMTAVLLLCFIADLLPHQSVLRGHVPGTDDADDDIQRQTAECAASLAAKPCDDTDDVQFSY